jgi:hypothetical protein
LGVVSVPSGDLFVRGGFQRRPRRAASAAVVMGQEWLAFDGQKISLAK